MHVDIADLRVGVQLARANLILSCVMLAVVLVVVIDTNAGYAAVPRNDDLFRSRESEAIFSKVIVSETDSVALLDSGGADSQDVLFT